FARIGHLELPTNLRVAGSPEEGYRMRARLHVRGRRLGFFREASHDICDIRQTRQLLPESCDVFDRLTAAARSLGIDAIRDVDYAENVEASDRVVALELSAPVDPRSVARLASTEGLTGLVAPGAVHGRPHVIDRLDVNGHRVELQRHVLSFFQGNRHL